MEIDTKVREALLAAKSDTEVLQIMAKETRKLKVLEIHRTSIQEWVEQKNGKEYHSFATRPNGQKKYVRAKTYDMLLDKLYDIYYGEKEVVLSAVWEDAKRNATVKTSTLRRYQSSWDTYFASYPIAKMFFAKLSADDWRSHYEMISQKHQMTKKQVSNARDVVSMIYRYAIHEKIVTHNPTRDILYSTIPVRKTVAYNAVRVKPFTEEEAEKITGWCKTQVKKAKSPAYYWAIVINLVLGLRVGELAALRWSDVNTEKKEITVKRQKVKDFECGDDGEISCVGYVEAGNLKGYEAPRTLALRDDVIDAFEQIRALNLDDTYVFPVFRYKTYTAKIKQAAEAIGLIGAEYSTHSLRATAATVLYLSCKNIYTVQALLGHTAVEMTLKYIKDIQITENLRAAMLADSALSLSCHFVPRKTAHSEQEKTPQTLDFIGFARSKLEMEHRGFEPVGGVFGPR